MEAGARRPIAARNLALSHAVAACLARRRVNPNAISVASLAFAGTAGLVASFGTGPGPAAGWAWLAVVCLVELRLVANMLDGMVALERGVPSKRGELYNEVPDRLSDAAALVGFGYAFGGDASLGFTAAIAAILTAYVRAIGTSVGAPADFRGPMAKPHRMHLLAAVALACAAAAFAGWRYDETIGPFGIPAIGLAVIAVGGFATAARRLHRIAGVLR